MPDELPKPKSPEPEANVTMRRPDVTARPDITEDLTEEPTEEIEQIFRGKCSLLLVSLVVHQCAERIKATFMHLACLQTNFLGSGRFPHDVLRITNF